MIYPWQSALWEQLTQSVLQQRPPQALLLTGPVGLGQVDLAKAFADYLLCESPETLRACGRCRSCRLALANNHPDFIEVTLQDKSKVIKINQVRSLTEHLQKTAFGHSQIALLYPADTMNAASANALLKTLEEPAGSVTLILVSSFPERLPITVRSRCQQISVKVTDETVVKEWLATQLPGKNTGLLFSAAHGSPLEAVSIADSDYLEMRDAVVLHLRRVLQREANSLDPVAGWLKGDADQLMQILISVSVDMVRVLMTPGVPTLIFSDCMSHYRSMQKVLTLMSVLNWYRSLLSAQALLRSGTHVNVQLLFETALLNWSSLR